MTQNKLVAYGLIASLFLCVITSFFENIWGQTASGVMYSFGGLGLMVFGIWASVILLKK